MKKFLVIALALGLSACGDDQPAADPSPVASEAGSKPNAFALISAGEEEVKKLLRDPDSAIFRNQGVNNPEGDVWVTCGEVNSRNGFGGMSGWSGYISNGVNITAIEEQVSDFHVAWNKLCASKKKGS